MRRVVFALLLGVFTVSAFGFTREGPRPRERDHGNVVERFVKRVVRGLADGLIIPSRP